MKNKILALILITILSFPSILFGFELSVNRSVVGSGVTIDASNNVTIPADKTAIHTFTEANWNEDDVTWTMTGAGPLVHVTGNTTAVTATNTEAIVAGTTYKVTITGTGGTATATYTLGGVTGTTIAASGAIAITDYITAISTASMIITPANTCTVSISAITIEKLTDSTGDLTVDGNATVRSPMTLLSSLTLPQVNNTATTTLSFGDGDSGFYEGSDDLIRVSIDGAGVFEINTNYIKGRSYAKTGALANNDVSSTIPGLTFSNDVDTGIGSAGADILSLIAGGVEAHRMTEAAGAIAHSLTGITVTPTTQTLTGAGAVDVESAITHIVTTAANALTLANGVEGQHKFIVMKTDAGAGTLTPTNPGNFATIVFDDVGDSAQLLFTNGKWHFMGGTATLT